MSEKSKLVLFVNADAIGKPPSQSRPALRAIFRLEGDTQDRVVNYPFAGIGQNDAIYARGTLADSNLRTAIAVRDGKIVTELPKGLDLKYGESALFEDKTATGENGRPPFYAYLHDGERIIRFAAWKKATGYFGEAKVWTPKGGPAADHDADFAAYERERAFDLSESGYVDRTAPDGEAARERATKRAAAAGQPTPPRAEKA